METLVRWYGSFTKRVTSGEYGEVLAMVAIAAAILAVCVYFSLKYWRKRRGKFVQAFDRWDPMQDLGVEAWCDLPQDNKAVLK